MTAWQPPEASRSSAIATAISSALPGVTRSGSGDRRFSAVAKLRCGLGVRRRVHHGHAILTSAIRRRFDLWRCVPELGWPALAPTVSHTAWFPWLG